jgi:chemotaxis signal transduction protein
VGDKQYALRGGDVRQIVRVEKMRTVAGSDGSVGALELAGQPVPVFRLGSVLGRTGAQRNAPNSGGHHIAVTGEGSELVGWLVDRVVRTPLSQDAQIVALPAVVGPAETWWLEAMVKVGGSSILLLAPQSPRSAVAAPAARQRGSGRPPPAREEARRFGRTDRAAVLDTGLTAMRGAALRVERRQVAAISQPMSPIPVPGSARTCRAWRGGAIAWCR